jgi:hypothetical protein
MKSVIELAETGQIAPCHKSVRASGHALEDLPQKTRDLLDPTVGELRGDKAGDLYVSRIREPVQKRHRVIPDKGDEFPLLFLVYLLQIDVVFPFVRFSGVRSLGCAVARRVAMDNLPSAIEGASVAPSCGKAFRASPSKAHHPLCGYPARP